MDCYLDGQLNSPRYFSKTNEENREWGLNFNSTFEFDMVFGRLIWAFS